MALKGKKKTHSQRVGCSFIFKKGLSNLYKREKECKIMNNFIYYILIITKFFQKIKSLLLLVQNDKSVKRPIAIIAICIRA